MLPAGGREHLSVGKSKSMLRLMEAGDGQAPVQPVRVFLLARLEILADCLERALLDDDCLHFAGSARALDDALELIGTAEPDVVLLDATLPGALSAARALVAADPRVRLLALGLADVPSEVLAFAEAGAAAYLVREGTLADLRRALRGVVAGEVDCPPKVAAALITRVGELASARPTGNVRLTARELEILRLIDCGLSNKQIARRLSIELATVKNHVHNILAKLEVTSRGDAARLLRSGGASADLVPA